MTQTEPGGRVTDLEPLYTVAEAAPLMGISERSLWEMVRKRDIETVRYGSARGTGKRSMTRVSQSVISAYIKRHTVPAVTS